jgi:hypothetical protein
MGRLHRSRSETAPASARRAQRLKVSVVKRPKSKADGRKHRGSCIETQRLLAHSALDLHKHRAGAIWRRTTAVSSAPFLRSERGQECRERLLSGFLGCPLRQISITIQLDAHRGASAPDFPSPRGAAIVAHRHDMIISPKQDHDAIGQAAPRQRRWKIALATSPTASTSSSMPSKQTIRHGQASRPS